MRQITLNRDSYLSLIKVMVTNEDKTELMCYS